jgi:hypothetical protein
MESASPRRPLLQFSLQSIMVVTILIGLGLGIYRQYGTRAVATYGLLLFAVGPWFAYLVSECLPIRSVAPRRTIAHGLLLALFGLGLWSSQVWRGVIDNWLAAWLLPAALILWVPQYLAFFVARPEIEQDER